MLAARLAASATELSMHNVYLATMIGAIISTSLASRVFALGAGRRRLSARARSFARALSVRLRKARDRRVAALLADWERRAAIYALRHMTDRELSDMGISRCSIEQVGRGLEREQRAAAQSCGRMAARAVSR
jgi:uncharacterized protein YjiS (DUF1127 family)